MDEVTQQNAALVEQAAAAAESLEDQAKALAKAVAVFNIGSAQKGRTAANELSRRHTDFDEITCGPQAASSKTAQTGRRWR
jgi:methyl-accepting chemotaxis protein